MDDSPDGFNDLQSPPACFWWKRGAAEQCLGRSRGGLTTKIHALVDGHGIVRRFLLSPGQRHDAPFALELLQGIELQKVFVLGDRGYDSQVIVSYIEENGGTVVIPSQKNRLVQRAYDAELYKLRNVIERFFSRLKQFR